MEKLPIMYTHNHSKVCEDFAMALQFKAICIINNEALIKGQFPEGTTTGNILTGETYNVDEFMCSLALKFCPFCGKTLHKPTDQAVYELCDICNHHDHDYSDIESGLEWDQHDIENDHYCTLKEICTDMDHFEEIPTNPIPPEPENSEMIMANIEGFMQQFGEDYRVMQLVDLVKTKGKELQAIYPNSGGYLIWLEFNDEFRHNYEIINDGMETLLKCYKIVLYERFKLGIIGAAQKTEEIHDAVDLALIRYLQRWIDAAILTTLNRKEGEEDARQAQGT